MGHQASETLALMAEDDREMDLHEALRTLRKISADFEAWAGEDDVTPEAEGALWEI